MGIVRRPGARQGIRGLHGRQNPQPANAANVPGAPTLNKVRRMAGLEMVRRVTDATFQEAGPDEAPDLDCQIKKL